MAAVRGCTNDDCAMKHKKTKFKADDLFCPKCGTKLVYVCADCHEPVEKMNIKYCGQCQEIRNTNKERKIAFLAGVGPAVLQFVNKDSFKKGAKTAVEAGGKVVKKVVKR